jgi:carbon-monoxide dehydrogenase medium subunit
MLLLPDCRPATHAKGLISLKPPPFTYWAPESLEEALSLLGQHGDDAKALAGGQSLVPLLALRLARPAALVDLGGLSELDYIRADNGTVAVGAMTRERTAERSATIRSAVPLLAESLPFIGHAAIRNRGTIGGSAAHADPAAEIPAVAMAVDAEFVVVSARGGERRIPAAEFFEGFFTTALAPDELLVEVRFPAAGPETAAAFEEAARRHGDFAMVAAAAAVRIQDGRIADVRLTLAGVSDTPVRCREAEDAVRGVAPSREVVAEAAALAAGPLSPPSDLHGTSAYRKHLAGVLVQRALTRSLEATQT